MKDIVEKLQQGTVGGQNIVAHAAGIDATHIFRNYNIVGPGESSEIHQPVEIDGNSQINNPVETVSGETPADQTAPTSEVPEVENDPKAGETRSFKLGDEGGEATVEDTDTSKGSSIDSTQIGI